MEERVVSPGANSPRFHTIRYLEDDGNVSESAQSDDSLDRLLQNYTINLMPKDARFKLRKK